MLRMTTMDFRPGATAYLLSGMGCEDIRDRETEQLAQDAARGDAVAYFETAERDGEAPGRWRGDGAAALGLTPGEDVTADDVRAVLGEARDPRTGERLGQEPRRYESRADKIRAWDEGNPDATEEQRRAEHDRIVANDRNAVAFYDLTFSAQKSASVYWAALQASDQHELAGEVITAHRAAVDAAMSELERHTWTRVGGHRRTADGSTAGEFQQATGLVGVEFDHSTSRETDPHMHTHAAVLNRVKCDDGKWRAIHAAAWKKIKPQVSAVYERVYAEEIERRTPARFVSRADGLGREIAGISAEVLEESSKRTAQVEQQQQVAEREFREAHGRAPTRREQAQLHRRAGLETRGDKTHAGPNEQIAGWAEGLSVSPADIAAEVRHTGDYIDRRGRPDGETRSDSRTELIRATLREVQARGSTWTPGELHAEFERQIPMNSAGDPDTDATTLAEALTREVVSPGSTWGVVDVSRPEAVPVPGWWRSSTGRAQWRDPALGRYTTHGQLARERDLVVTARQPTHPAADPDTLTAVETQLTERGMSPDQVAAVTGILGSPRAADALVSAAGTGKSFTVGQLADVWEQHREGRVLGVATSQIATQVLNEDGLDAVNTTLFLRDFEVDPEVGRARKTLTSADMLVVDESNMSSTAELARVQRIAAESGAKLVYTGDPQQLQAVGAGGALGLIASENGAYELEQVHRLQHQWERDASLQLRDGNVDVLDEYEQRGRIRGGDETEMRRQAVAGYLADTLDGKASLLVTGTNAEAASAAADAQRELSRLGRVGDLAASQLMDGNEARIGDLVMARRNDRRQRTAGELSQVTNRERYRVLAVEDDRLAVATEDGTGRAWLSDEYVREHLTLGYAGTEHAAEGVSVDTAHTLHPGYVAMTRGKEANTAYITTTTDGDEHGPGVETTAREVLAQALSRDGLETTAVEQMEQETANAGNLQTLLAAWDYTGRELDGYRHGDVILSTLGPGAAQRIEGETGRTSLYETMREAETRGHDVTELLDTATNRRGVDNARELAGLLNWRIRAEMDNHGTGQEQTTDAPDTWTRRTAHLPGQLGAYRHRIAEQMDARTTELGARAGRDTPEWALSAVGAPPPAEQEQARAEWEARAGQIAAWRELSGRDGNETDTALGEPPTDWLHRAQYEQAARAAGLDHGEARSTDAELHAATARGDREAAWAPEYVADKLGTAREIEQRRQQEARLARRRAETSQDADQRQREEQAAARGEAIAQRMGARARILEGLHQTRQGWLAATAEVRTRADAARAELRRRTQQRGQQTEDQNPDQQKAREGQQETLDVTLTDLDAMTAEQQRDAVTRVEQRDQQRAEDRRAETRDDEQQPEQDRARDTGRDDTAATEPNRERDTGQTELFAPDTARKHNTDLDARAESLEADTDALEASREPARGRESVRDAEVKARHAQMILERRQERERRETEAETEQQQAAEQQQTREATADIPAGDERETGTELSL